MATEWQPGALIARGRDADVFDCDGRALRRYRRPHDTEKEVRAMRHLSSHGFPPAVYGFNQQDILMERITGPDLLQAMSRRHWRLASHAAQLAGLHDRLHALPQLPGLPAPFGPGGSIQHLDLHPLNAILSPRGPVLIDWTNVAQGDGHADIAQSWVIMATSVIGGAGLERMSDALFAASLSAYF